MQLKSLSKISIVGFGNIFNAFLGFFFLSAVAKTLTVEQFGKYALLTSLLVSISKIIDFGTNSIFVARSISNSKNIENTFVSLKFVLFLVTIPISVAALFILKLLTWQLFIIFLLGLIFYGINITLFAFFQRKEFFKEAVLLNTLPATVKGLIALATLTNVLKLDFVQAFAVFSVAMSLSTLLAGFVWDDLKKIKFTTQGISEFLTNSIFAGISQIINNGWSAISNSIAKLIKGFTDVGIFSLADKIANIFSLISISIFTVLLPKNAQRRKNQLGYDYKETGIIAGGILIMSLAAMFAARILINVVFQEKFADSIPLINILIAASSITAIHTFIENYFFVEEKTSQLFFITSTKLIAFLALCFLLIPIYSLQGLALAQLIAAIIGLIGTFYFIGKARS